MPGNRRFVSTAVVGVQEPHRTFLMTVGLPEGHPLFAVAEPASHLIELRGAAREFLRVGEGGDYEDFCLDPASGEIVTLNTADSRIWHVNQSPEKFVKSLEIFMERFPYGGEDTTLEEREELATALGEALLGIDPTALDEDPGFWHTILADVAIGDYSEDEA